MLIYCCRPVIEEESLKTTSSNSSNSTTTAPAPRKGKGSSSKSAPKKKHDELWNGEYDTFIIDLAYNSGLSYGFVRNTE